MCTWMSHVTQCTLFWDVGRVIVEWILMHEPCHVWTSHVSFMNESCAYVHVNESCHTWVYVQTVLVFETSRRRMNPYEWAMPRVNASCHVWMSHVTLMNELRMNESCECVHMNAWYHTWVCVFRLFRIWQAAPYNEYIWMSHCEWVMSHVNAWCHKWRCVQTVLGYERQRRTMNTYE
jgi:hypothetical protein